MYPKVRHLKKLLAAHRGGIKTVLIPEENRKDLSDIPEDIQAALEVIPVRWIDEVLDIALVSSPYLAKVSEVASEGSVEPSEEGKKGEARQHH